MKKFFMMMIFLLSTFGTAYCQPARYDLREHGRITSVKHQGIPGPCWAFAAIGAMESNWLTQNPGSIADLSEMQIAFYCYRDPEKKRNFTSHVKSGTLSLEGNVFMPVALMSRLSGPVDEKSLPYSTRLTDSEKKALSKKSPESFKRSMRLKEAYFLSGSKIPSVDEMKSLIMNHGAIVVSLYSDAGKYRNINGHYTYFNNSHGSETNHDVIIAGWDDEFSRLNFSPRPSRNGAWLVKNSWGTGRGNEGGYFWLSYEQKMTGGAAFIAERFDRRLKHYGYDDLGYCGAKRFSRGANVFRVSGKVERLKEIAFYTLRNNESYEASVYLHGKKAPSSPVDGDLISTVSGVHEFAGYHTVTLPETVTLKEGEYFSVVLKLSGGYMPVEEKHENYSENAEVNRGESYFSVDGKKWVDGFGLGCNVCVKAFALCRM